MIGDNLRKLLQQVHAQLVKATNEAKAIAESPDPIVELARVHGLAQDMMNNDQIDQKEKAKKISEYARQKDQLLRLARGWNTQANWDRYHMQNQMLQEFLQHIGPMMIKREPQDVPVQESIEDAK